jgi:octaheme c-type cytochrome (tetrathionate reductase family)
MKVYLLDSAMLNTRADYYEPVRFSHVSHDEHTGGDCGLCHHRFSIDEEDRVGFDLHEFHMECDVRLGGPCSSCHDMDLLYVQGCDRCHWQPNEPDERIRPGLGGAYHRRCIGCHEDPELLVRAPTACTGCHHPVTPDHGELVVLRDGVAACDITRECLCCHPESGHEILRTAHWNWGGHSPEVCDHEHSGDLGLETLVNNYMIGVAPNREYCGTCHIGLGCVADQTLFTGPESIDCLVCHDTSGTYGKQIGAGGEPGSGIDLARVASAVGRPSRTTCGSCHFYSDGGPNMKHGDLEPALADPPDDLDVHMGRYDMRCQDCHLVENHRIAGMSMSAPAVEGRVSCRRCHGETAHGISGILGAHLDDHLDKLSCEVCHIPTVARYSPTRLFVDYRKAEQYGPVPPGEMGLPAYPPKSGVEIWQTDLVPVYRWYDGSREAYVIGDRIDPDETVVLNRPLGERRNPRARIYPFKVHRAVQPYDRQKLILVLPRLWEGFWNHFDLAAAIEDGMQAAGLEYSGDYGFVETVMYTGIHHEVAPAPAALGCGDCHERKHLECSRCHERLETDQDFLRIVEPRYPGVQRNFPDISPV